MGIIPPDHDEQRVEMEEFRLMLASTAALSRRKDEEGEFRNRRGFGRKIEDEDVRGKLICVTSGLSYLGLAIVNQLLARGYSVRLILHNQEDVEKLREMELSGEIRGPNSLVEAVMANLLEAEGLPVAFEGCFGVLHTAAFIDPAGLSGYSKWMAEIEAKVSENVIKACAITQSVRHCVLTSSLLSCIWRDPSQIGQTHTIDQDCWSDESCCRDKKLWYALGKLRAERAAWRVAKEMGLKLATVCPGLIVGPEFHRRNSTSTIAYLKGAQDMYANGLLATVDVNRLAKAHVCVFEAMNKGEFGRYICFDQIINSEEEAQKLGEEIGLQTNLLYGSGFSSPPTRMKLSNSKLSKLMLRTLRCNT